MVNFYYENLDKKNFGAILILVEKENTLKRRVNIIEGAERDVKCCEHLTERILNTNSE